VWPFVFWGTLLLYLGVAFCFWLVLPQAFRAMLLGFGVIFAVPVVIAFLAIVGLVSWRWLAKYRRHAIVLNVVLAAIITPTGDPFNLALLAVPMILFYEVGIVLARVLGKRPAALAASRERFTSPTEIRP